MSERSGTHRVRVGTPSVTEHRRIGRLEELAGRARRVASLGEAPFLAHARVRAAAGGERDLLFGTRTHVGGGLALLDWRTAPLSEVLLGVDEGEEYQLEVAGRSVEGTLLERNLVVFRGGVLAEVLTAEAKLVRGEGGWRVEPRGAAALSPRPEALRSRPAGLAALTLDPAQRALLELPEERSLLVLGEAGCGKTTVALHRAAALCRRAREAGRRFRAAVVVPTEGLCALSRALLAQLGAEDVDVWRFDRLAAVLARRAVPDLPHRESGNASAAVMRLKRHPALRVALAALAPLDPAIPEEARPHVRARPLASWHDLHALFGDSALLARVHAAAAGELPAHAMAEALEHARLQHSTPADEEFAEVLPEARRTVDGRPIDEGTPMEDAGTVDPEDHAVLLELVRLRAEARRQPPPCPVAWDHLVVDEGQEFAPLELALLGRCLAPGASVTVAGDADQQVDPSCGFAGWAASLRELGAEGAEAVQLEVSHRCPPAVTELARRLRAGGGTGALGPGSPAVLGYLEHPNELHLVAWLIEAIAALREEDRGTSVAVICRTPATAARVAWALGHGTEARLALDGQFRFAPCVQVTTVDDARGLEFEHVVLPDASVGVYPATDPARRALYVALTRTRHQLVLAGAGRASTWLEPTSGCGQDPA